MTMQETVEDTFMVAILTDAAIKAIFDPLNNRDVAEWSYTSSAVGIGPNLADPPKPWMAWNELPSIPFLSVSETSDAQARSFQFFVYDDRGDFTRINLALREIRRVVKALAPFATLDGTRCSHSEWVGISGQLPADQYDGVCRFGTVRFIVSQ